jgi:hypothetical protein
LFYFFFSNEGSAETRERLETRYESMNASRIGIFNNNNELVYGLWHNTLSTRLKLLQIQDLITRTRLKTASIFGQNIVIDFGYEEFMNSLAVKELMSYIKKFYSFNKYSIFL